MNKKPQPVELTMDMILKMTPEVFRDTVKAQNLGFKISLANLLKAQFEQCKMAKDSLATVLSKAGDSIPSEAEKEYMKAINDLYMCMQLIEDRHTILSMLIKEM